MILLIIWIIVEKLEPTGDDPLRKNRNTSWFALLTLNPPLSPSLTKSEGKTQNKNKSVVASVLKAT